MARVLVPTIKLTAAPNGAVFATRWTFSCWIPELMPIPATLCVFATAIREAFPLFQFFGVLCHRPLLLADLAANCHAIDHDGRLHSGDLATMDVNDYCKITGRAKDVIIRGGEISILERLKSFSTLVPGS